MKTIQFTGTVNQIDDLTQNLSDEHLDLITETRVYVVNREDITTDVDKLTDEEFISLAELGSRVYSLEGFQKTFNEDKDKVSHSEDGIRFINVPLNN